MFYAKNLERKISESREKENENLTRKKINMAKIKEQKLDATIVLRCTKNERNDITMIAKSCGITTSYICDYVLSIISQSKHCLKKK